MRLSSCKRCGADTVIRAGIKAGKPYRMQYNADAEKLHKFECEKLLVKAGNDPTSTRARRPEKFVPHRAQSQNGFPI